MSEVAAAFLAQADHCDDLGSPFTANLCRLFAERLDRSTLIGRICFDWSGSASHRADAVPLRVCGGLHHLVLAGREPHLAKVYPPYSLEAPNWTLLRDVFERQADFFQEWMISPPQTNEVRRSNMIWPAVCVVAQKFGLPVEIAEIGASGGLNLQMDRFGYVMGQAFLGSAQSAVQLEPQWRGAELTATQATIQARRGCDINPLNPLNEADNLRLRSYIWADQIDRLERHDRAVSIAAAHPVSVEKRDAVSFLRDVLAKRKEGAVCIIYSTIAWQYLTDDDKAEGTKLLNEAGAKATQSAPLAWLKFEGDGQSPGGRISAQFWPDGEERTLGRADFHGRWVDWCE